MNETGSETRGVNCLEKQEKMETLTARSSVIEWGIGKQTFQVMKSGLKMGGKMALMRENPRELHWAIEEMSKGYCSVPKKELPEEK